MDYINIYKRRLNRYGLDYQSRIQGQRDQNFEDYLLKSIYRVDFWHNDIYHPATLERYKQDHTETQCYLLTRRDLVLENGTMIEIESRNGEKKWWMVWWLEQIEQSGYNRYVVLRMTHCIDIPGVGNVHAYFSGPGTSTIQDAIKSSSGEALYKENNNLHMFVTAYNKGFKKDGYFEVNQGETAQTYVIMEMDIHSTPGVVYISVDPSYKRDDSTPVMSNKEQSWLNWEAKK